PGCWVSTAIILAASAAIHWAYARIKRGDRQGLQRGLMLTLLCGGAFLILQIVNWFFFVRGIAEVSKTLFGFSFYVLTGLHALHVVAGLIQLAVVTVRAGQGRYTAESHGAIWYSVMYWHFLDVAWLVLYAALMILV
ncbi:MAG: heme-copper oxidase subunit III, partial [Acidobacteria bacterium]|nr:heme-copper oxidase subunit III [Acidobacteriota bacterium]